VVPGLPWQLESNPERLQPDGSGANLSFSDSAHSGCPPPIAGLAQMGLNIFLQSESAFALNPGSVPGIQRFGFVNVMQDANKDVNA
jgi:hypothetical protein